MFLVPSSVENHVPVAVSSDFKTILKGSSFLGLRSWFCTHPTNRQIQNTGRREQVTGHGSFLYQYRKYPKH